MQKRLYKTSDLVWFLTICKGDNQTTHKTEYRCNSATFSGARYISLHNRQSHEISISIKFRAKIEISDDMMKAERISPLRTYSWFGKEYNPIIIASVNFTMPYANERATFWADEHQIVTNQYDSVLQRQTDSGMLLYQARHDMA